ncbi:uncharacterized protein LOC122454969 [Cervus canadensis]|uniref:uncharacterized protein LOC122454969 n=1 Tax=Cervus canadensis TaxID=1574408 RepID=UPI001C9E3FF8|nr:uncharacterized protein LOC122454969 [Cervus canadensis]
MSLFLKVKEDFPIIRAQKSSLEVKRKGVAPHSVALCRPLPRTPRGQVQALLSLCAAPAMEEAHALAQPQQGLFQRLLEHTRPSSRKEQRRSWSEGQPRWWGRAEAAAAGPCEWGPLQPPRVPSGPHALQCRASARGGRLRRWPQSSAHHPAAALVFCGGLSFSKSTPGCGAPRRHPLSLSPLSQQQSPSGTCSPNPSFLTLPCAHWRTPISGWGAPGCGLDHLCGFPSVLPASAWLLRSPWSPQASLQPQLMALLVRGFPRYETLFQLSLSTKDAAPFCFLSSFSFLFSFILSDYTGICLAPPVSQVPYLRSSARIQQVL